MSVADVAGIVVSATIEPLIVGLTINGRQIVDFQDLLHRRGNKVLDL